MNYCQVSKVFQARLHVLDLPETKKLISPGSQAVIHLHASVENVQIEDVEAVESAETHKLVKTTFLKSNQVGIVKISVIHLLFSVKTNYAYKSMILCLNSVDSL